LSNVNTFSNLNPIVLNAANFSESGYIDIYNSISFNYTVNDWKMFIKGDLNNLNITTLAYYVNGSALNDTKTVNVSYSPYNVTSAYDDLNFLPTSLTQNNISPYGQSNVIPYWNITALSTSHITDMYVHNEETMPACAKLSATNTSSGTKVNLTTTGQKVLSLNGSNGGIWHYLNLNACTQGFFINVTIDSLCSDCVVTYDAFSRV
jgi:hypothetical protein